MDERHQVPGEGPLCYVFPNGQYIGKYSSENVYYCGADGSSLTDMVFYYDEAAQAFYNFQHILINSSQTVVDYWCYFSDVIVSKDRNVPSGIDQLSNRKATEDGLYDLQGRRVAKPSHGLYIVNGRKVVVR